MMKIFKHRGDIYISKSEYKRSQEEHILIILLVIIIIFTVVFFGILSHKYSSVREFFGEGSITTTTIAEDSIDDLPEISGKRNFLIIETDNEESCIHFAFLVQADRDSQAYKICTLSPRMDIDGLSLYDLYSLGGGATIQTQLSSYLGINIDYYATFTTDNFIELVNKLGTFIYPSPETIKFNYEKSEEDKYSVRISEGEEKMTGSKVSDLLRYYSNDGVNYTQSNQIILYGLTQLLNSENFEDSEGLFKLFMNTSTTNITVRNFQDNKDALEVFCKNSADISLYSANAFFDDSNVIMPESVKEIKGYFSE